jgi:predicted XRE-type DNA-binding protein
MSPCTTTRCDIAPLRLSQAKISEMLVVGKAEVRDLERGV